VGNKSYGHCISAGLHVHGTLEELDLHVQLAFPQLVLELKGHVVVGRGPCCLEGKSDEQSVQRRNANMLAGHG